MPPGRQVRSLLLNASGEPLHVCDARRALLLVLDQTADVVLDSDTVVHSQYVNFTLPSVVRLRRFVNVPRGRSIPLTTRTVIARDGGVCAYCNDPADTMDHIVPRAQGGPHTWENCVAACRRCNHRKGSKTPEQAKMPLLHKPTRPRGAHARLLLYAVSPEWTPFLLQEV
jgi:5-methylcytosine-specific restriction endonuclease McrA